MKILEFSSSQTFCRCEILISIIISWALSSFSLKSCCVMIYYEICPNQMNFNFKKVILYLTSCNACNADNLQVIFFSSKCHQIAFDFLQRIWIFNKKHIFDGFFPQIFTTMPWLFYSKSIKLMNFLQLI